MSPAFDDPHDRKLIDTYSRTRMSADGWVPGSRLRSAITYLLVGILVTCIMMGAYAMYRATVEERVRNVQARAQAQVDACAKAKDQIFREIDAAQPMTRYEQDYQTDQWREMIKQACDWRQLR